MRWGGLACAISLALAGCADPHFVHDPQVGYFSQSQLPALLKSLRCELTTYIAANNQNQIINNYLFAQKREKDPVSANSDYSFFPIDPGKYGGISLELKIQDSLGTQSGTSFDWKRSPADGIHTKVWHIAPTLSEQNSYDMLTGFLLQQDIYGLDTSDRLKPEPDVMITDSNQPYLCYKNIPQRDPPIVDDPRVTNAVYVQQDLDAISANIKGTPQFERILVNASLPLAAWLQQASKTLTSTSVTQSNEQKNEAISPGQLSYTFVIQTTAGLDVRNTIATTLWTGIGGEVSGSWQHTGTMTIYLNGNDSLLTSAVKNGSAERQTSKQIYPPIKTKVTPNYCELPALGGVARDNTANCLWPPVKPKAAKARSLRETAKSVKPNVELLEQNPSAKRGPKPTAQKKKATTIRRAVVPAFRNFRSPGTVDYPVPLSPLGTPGP